MVGVIAFVTAGHVPFAAQAVEATWPAWIVKLIAAQRTQSRTLIEEDQYRGRRVFVVMPLDRGPDTGNEHVLHAEDGHVICEFGGIAGRLTRGSCDIGQIRFGRTLFPKRQR